MIPFCNTDSALLKLRYARWRYQKMRGYRDLCLKLCNEIYECKALICGHKLTRGAKVGHFTRLNITFCFRSDGSQVKRLGVIATEFREWACIVEIGYKLQGVVKYTLSTYCQAPEVCREYFGIMSSWKAKGCNFALLLNFFFLLTDKMHWAHWTNWKFRFIVWFYKKS